ncbi:Aste57867_18735 [Aphanomyces stellatus]|uniref:Aste57867_18735 protein n=1 Tax=Aphanomyces stellatus TaxID=120398 RepID=A0A485LEW3_9STRA|nr:hypothetical protein As57867_018671 [Aphanomyces stellatus]VFT95469.1 Aste57867_18735 [Aphanomyces stellatus]
MITSVSPVRAYTPNATNASYSYSGSGVTTQWWFRGSELWNESPAMLCFNTVALMLSASMTLTACCTVFKWSSVRRNPAHGTLCLVFLSLGLWSFSLLISILFTHSFKPYELMRLHKKSLIYLTAVSDMFFNATSLWCLLATYEFQRFVWLPVPRRRRRRAMVWYILGVHAIGLAYLVAVVFVETNHPIAAVKFPLRVTDAPPPILALVDAFFWVFYAVRWLAVVYPVVLGVVFGIHQRSAMTKRSRSIVLFVTLLVGLNLPYLVLDPLFTQGVLSVKTQINLFGISKLATYCSGVGMVYVLGLYLGDFDQYYSPPSPKDEKRRRHAFDTTTADDIDPAFLVFHSDCSSPSMIQSCRR